MSNHAFSLPFSVVVEERRINNPCYIRHTSLFVFRRIPRADVKADFVRAVLRKYERVVCWPLSNPPNLRLTIYPFVPLRQTLYKQRRPVVHPRFPRQRTRWPILLVHLSPDDAMTPGHQHPRDHQAPTTPTYSRSLGQAHIEKFSYTPRVGLLVLHLLRRRKPRIDDRPTRIVWRHVDELNAAPLLSHDRKLVPKHIHGADGRATGPV